MLTIGAADIARLYQTVGHIKGGVPKVLVPAINRALDKGRTTVSREIRKQYLIKNKDIPIKVRGASTGNLGGEIVVQDGMIKLNKFKVTPRGVQRRKKKKPVTAAVKVGGGKAMPGGFVAQMPTGYVGPFIRSSSRKMAKKPWKDALNVLQAIGAAIMASQPAVGPAASEAMGTELAKRIDHELKRVLGGAGK